MSVWLILLAGLLLDRKFGEPEALWSRMPHPVVLFGKAVSWVDRRFNQEGDDDGLRYRKGALSIAGLIVLAIVAGLFAQFVFELLGPLWFVGEVFLVFVLIAQKSLMEHVGAVSRGLREGGLDGGRKAVGMIVGRDPSRLDRSAVSRAAVETLGENFSDGVVAPAFWYLVFGLPGLFAYKIVNTADSMIGYHTERHEYFGKAAAKIDDLANWLPARISAFLLASGALSTRGMAASGNALQTAFHDAGLHRSPNAGWPEAALAGACGFALGGPRVYPGETVAQAFINAAGKRELDAPDIDLAIAVVRASCTVLALVILAGAVLF